MTTTTTTKFQGFRSLECQNEANLKLLVVPSFAAPQSGVKSGLELGISGLPKGSF